MYILVNDRIHFHWISAECNTLLAEVIKLKLCLSKASVTMGAHLITQ